MSWTHQIAACAFARDKVAAMLAMAMGTGKSKVAVDLLLEWGAHPTLIICPVSVRDVWRREFAKWGQGQFDVLILDNGSVADKMKKASLAALVARAEGRKLAVVINYEAAWRKPFAEWSLQQLWGCVILDESHRAKAHNTRVSKYVAKLASRAVRRLCLTGTPMPHSPLDVFGQCRFLDWRLFGRRWTPFKHSFTECNNPYIPQQITGYRNLDILQERFGRIAYQVSADVLDLPPVSHHTRTFELPRMAGRIYRDLESEFAAELDTGVITAANVLVKTLRLRQLVSGFVQPDDTPAITEVHAGKEALLADLLQDLGEPCVVFAEFRQDLNVIRRTAEKLKLRYGEVSGRQNDLTDEATYPVDVDVLGVQYQSGGVGVDLSGAGYGIYFSPTYSLGNYEQSLARLHRPGQQGHVHYYHLVARGTIDELVYKALEEKRDIVEAILGALRRRQAG